MTKTMQKFLSAQEGATAIEYASLTSLVAFVLVTSLAELGSRLGG